MAADSISIAASIVDVSATGFKTAQGLYNITASIGSSGEGIRLFASDTDILSQILYNLSQTLESSQNSTTLSSRLLVTIEDAAKLCEPVLQPFGRIIERLNPLLVRFKDNEKKLQQLEVRIRWLFRENSRLLFNQRMLNALRCTLICLLASMNLKTASDVGPQRTAYVKHLDADDFGCLLTWFRILRMQVENAQGVVKHELEMPPTRFFESSSSTSTNYSDRSFLAMISGPQGQIDKPGKETFNVGRRYAESSGPRTGNSQSIEDGLEIDESFYRHIDEILGTHGGSFDHFSQDLYEDIRSIQRKVVELARKCLEATEDLPPSYDHSLGSTSGSHILRTQPRVNTSSDIADRHGISVTIPYQSSKSEKSERGLTLLELREKNQILIEDTLGYFHYVPSSIGESWEVS